MDSGILMLILGAVVAVLGLGGLSAIRKKSSGRGPSSGEIKEQINELKKKPAADIVNGLDNSADVERIKEQSSGEIDSAYESRKKRKRRDHLDRFRG